MGNRHTSIRSMLEGYEGDTNPTLQDLLQDDGGPFKTRTAAEDQVWSSTPGNEDRQGHVFPPSKDGIPYIHTDYAELRRLFNDPDTPAKERMLVEDAMRLLGVPRRDAPTEVRDEDFNSPDLEPHCKVLLKTSGGKVYGHTTSGYGVTRADPSSR